jgi:hypothetical protein
MRNMLALAEEHNYQATFCEDFLEGSASGFWLTVPSYFSLTGLFRCIKLCCGTDSVKAAFTSACSKN